MKNSHQKSWERAIELIQSKVTDQQFSTWFGKIVFESFCEETKTVMLRVPSHYVYEYLEANYVSLMRQVLYAVFGDGVGLAYRVMVDKQHGETSVVDSEGPEVELKHSKPNSRRPDIDPQLNLRQNFDNYIEGESNKLGRSLGLSIAEHPKKHQFNPFFLFGPSGCGKTHLINAMGVKVKQLYPSMRVLYVSARVFQMQYTTAVTTNTVNDFMHFYQSIDMLIVDDVQEWEGKESTLGTFFFVFDHLIRNNKRVVLASDRPPVEMKAMPERMLTRFAGGIVVEMSSPNVELCVDILKSLIRRDGLDIAPEVVRYIAETAHGSIRDLQGVVNSLVAYSVVYSCDIDLELVKTVTGRIRKKDDSPLEIGEIVDVVAKHYKVTPAAINGKSRKKEVVEARQLAMYFAQKFTHMPASRIGKLIGQRDHSTVLHSIAKIEERLASDAEFAEEVRKIEKSFKLKQ